MFKKIVSNLPFSPALVGQLGFYAKRLRAEEATRRLGLIFVALALVVQSLAVFQPAQSANASSGGDFITGGIPGDSVSELLKIYDNNTQNFRDSMNHVGIDRDDLAATTLKTFKTGSKIIWGSAPHYSSDKEKKHNVYNPNNVLVKSIYSRPLSLSGGPDRVFTGWVGEASFGWFAIRQSCGNLITIDLPPEGPKMCTLNTEILASSDDCKPCPYNSALWINSSKCTKPVVVEPTKCIYSSSILASSKDCKPCPYNLFIWINSSKCIKPVIIIEEEKCALNPNILANNAACKPCPGNETLWINDTSCTPNIVKTKTVTNITQGSVNASSVVAKASDQLSYTITVENTGLNSASPVQLQENLSDVLEYATIIDNGGGKFDSTSKTLSWPDITLTSKAKQTRTFVVKLAATIPATARGASNDTSYDCILTNTFGNSTNVRVDCPMPKVVEQVVVNLPVTGPKENIIFSGIILAITAYFYARARQQGKEIRLIRKDVSTGTI